MNYRGLITTHDAEGAIGKYRIAKFGAADGGVAQATAATGMPSPSQDSASIAPSPSSAATRPIRLASAISSGTAKMPRRPWEERGAPFMGYPRRGAWPARRPCAPPAGAGPATGTAR